MYFQCCEKRKHVQLRHYCVCLLCPIIVSLSISIVTSECTDTADLLKHDDQLQDLFENNGGLDFVLLGMGRDGHIASIFPKEGVHTRHGVGKHLSVTQLKSDYPIYVKERVSLQLSSIIGCNKIGLLLTGSNKCQMMKYVYELTLNDTKPLEDHNLLPVVQLLMNEQANLSLYFDKNCMCKNF